MNTFLTKLGTKESRNLQFRSGDLKVQLTIGGTFTVRLFNERHILNLNYPKSAVKSGLKITGTPSLGK